MGSEVAQLLEAADFAAHKHREQRRKDPEGTPYINHPIGGCARGETVLAARVRWGRTGGVVCVHAESRVVSITSHAL